jgi:type II secretory pathway pseudopilin PulG
MNKKAFSLVEIIIVISIVVLLSVVWVSINSQFKEKSESTKISTDIETIKSSLIQYKQENKTLPLPGGNINFFTSVGLYSHDETNAFWVYGSITEMVIPKKYMSFTPLDPRINQYYAFGKTIKDNTFEVAGVIKKDGDYVTKIVGDYSGEGGPYNLIREYNGPEFVNDASNLHFPYNPEERIMTAHIGSFSGSISINGIPKTSTWEILGFTFKEKDTLSVGIWAYANIYYSDGSMSTLWDSLVPTELYFANMKYSAENNLITKIKLALKTWAIWTKASKLGKNSDFEIYTTDSTAAVRGTIFWVRKVGLNITDITVTIGKVDIKKNSHYDPNYNFEKLIQEITNDSVPQYPAYVGGGVKSNLTMIFWPGIYESYVEVLPWQNPKWIKMENWSVTDENMTPTVTPATVIGQVINRQLDSAVCPHTIAVDGECIYNWLASKGWELIWYASYDNNLNIITGVDSSLHPTTQSGIILENGWVVVWGILTYDISSLGLSDKFAIEAEVKGSDLNSYTGTAPIFLYSLSNLSKKIESGINKAGWLKQYYINYPNTLTGARDWIDVIKNYSVTTFIEKNSIGISQDNTSILAKKENNLFDSPTNLFVGTNVPAPLKSWLNWIYSLKIYKK